MQLTCAEDSNRRIAAEMKLKQRTIEWYWEGILQKTGAKTIGRIVPFTITHKVYEFPIYGLLIVI